MLDTCTLGLSEFEISDDVSEVDSAIQSGGVLKKWSLRARNEDVARNFRVSIVHNPVRIDGTYEQRRSIHVETALPKLIYGNSIQEIVESDLERASILIRDALLSGYGIKTNTKAILESALKRVDFTRNILLPVPAPLFFEKAQMCTKKRGSTFSNVAYGVDRSGSQLRWYSKYKALSIYDKGAEVRSNHVGWIGLLEAVTKGNVRCALIRFEVRLMGRAIQKELAKRLAIDGVRFADVWNEDLSCQIIFDQLASIPGLPCVLKDVTHQRFEVPHDCSKKDTYLLETVLRRAERYGFAEALEELKGTFSKDAYYRLVHLLPKISNHETQEVDLWEAIAGKLNHSSLRSL